MVRHSLSMPTSLLISNCLINYKLYVFKKQNLKNKMTFFVNAIYIPLKSNKNL